MTSSSSVISGDPARQTVANRQFHKLALLFRPILPEPALIRQYGVQGQVLAITLQEQNALLAFGVIRGAEVRHIEIGQGYLEPLHQ